MTNTKTLPKDSFTKLTKVKYNIKDSLFCIIFNTPKAQLELYNALTGKAYTDPSLLTTVTLERAIYLGMKNDAAFIMSSEIMLVEQQSTLCANMPLRQLFYIAEEYKSMVDSKKIYYGVRYNLPNPRFIVLYNGKDKTQSRWSERLSDSFKRVSGDEVALELVVQFYNLNHEHNVELKKRSKLLGEYCAFVDKFHEYQVQGVPRELAAHQSIDDCIKENILVDYLKKERDAVMCSILYDHISMEEYLLGVERENGIIEGEQRGFEKALTNTIIKMFSNNMSISTICEILELSSDYVSEIINIESSTVV